MATPAPRPSRPGKTRPRLAVPTPAVPVLRPYHPGVPGTYGTSLIVFDEAPGFGIHYETELTERG